MSEPVDNGAHLATADQTRGGWIDPARGRISLRAYAKAWLADRLDLRPRTAELYEGLLKLHIYPALGEVELSKLTPSVIRRWHAGLLKAEKPGRRRSRSRTACCTRSSRPRWQTS